MKDLASGRHGGGHALTRSLVVKADKTALYRATGGGDSRDWINWSERKSEAQKEGGLRLVEMGMWGATDFVWKREGESLTIRRQLTGIQHL